MMTKKRTGSLSSIKMLLAIPLALTMFFTFSCNVKAQNNLTQQDKDNTTSQDSPSQQKQYDEIFVVVEQMPSFPGGDSLLIKHISDNIVYPETAKKNKIQGAVIVKFCVTSKGEIDLVTVVRSVAPSLDEEAVRVIKALPKFNPGKQGGKPVNVWYSLPISFKLQ